jgi:DNA repair protein RadD
MNDQDYTMMAVMELVQKARYHSRKSWLIFAVSIKHAEHILEQLLDQDVEAAMITGKTPKTERAKTIAAFKAGKITALVNVAVLTTGFDAPNCDLIALLRPTVSPVLYVQIAGRGMRTNEGKENCLWLDFTDTTERLGAVDTIKGRNKPKLKNSESDSQGVKICPSCEAENAPASKFCIECGEQLRDDVVFKVKAASSDSAVLSTQEKPREFVIDQWFLNHYTSKKGNEMLELCYYLHSLRPNMIKRWISFEGVDFMVSIANKWWLNHGGQLPLPTTNDEAVTRFSELPQPETVWAKKNDQGYFNPV